MREQATKARLITLIGLYGKLQRGVDATEKDPVLSFSIYLFPVWIPPTKMQIHCYFLLPSNILSKPKRLTAQSHLNAPTNTTTPRRCTLQFVMGSIRSPQDKWNFVPLPWGKCSLSLWDSSVLQSMLWNSNGKGEDFDSTSALPLAELARSARTHDDTHTEPDRGLPWVASGPRPGIGDSWCRDTALHLATKWWKISEWSSVFPEHHKQVSREVIIFIRNLRICRKQTIVFSCQTGPKRISFLDTSLQDFCGVPSHDLSRALTWPIFHEEIEAWQTNLYMKKAAGRILSCSMVSPKIIQCRV